MRTRGHKRARTDKAGITPFAVAASNNRVEVMKMLAKVPGVDINKPGNDGTTTFINAVTNNNVEVCTHACKHVCLHAFSMHVCVGYA